MSNIVQPNSLYPGYLAPVFHLMIQETLGVGKHAVIRLQLVAMGHILLEASAQTVRDRNGAVALGRFGRGHDVLSIQPLVAFADRQRFLLKVNICRSQRKQLALTDACIVHGHEDGVIYNAPLDYAAMVLNGDPEKYLKAVTEYKPLDN